MNHCLPFFRHQEIMGVSGLTKLIRKEKLMKVNQKLLEDDHLTKTKIIIDGTSLLYSLYFDKYKDLDKSHGGDYSGFKDVLCQFFDILKECEVECHVILDGCPDPDKQNALKSRREASKTAKDASPLSKGSTLPPLCKDVFIQFLQEKHIQFTQCFEEADKTIAYFANEEACPVLSSDSDFFIFDLHAGFLPLDDFQWKEGDGRIPAKRYRIAKFCTHFRLDPALMPVFASIAGNDYSKLEENTNTFVTQYPESKMELYPINRLCAILLFLRDLVITQLSDPEKKKKALKEALMFVGETEEASFLRSIEKYTIQLPELPELPDWVCTKIQRGQLTSYVRNIEIYEQEKLQLKDLDKAHVNLRLRVLKKALDGESLNLENIPEHLQLPLCVTSYWWRYDQKQTSPANINCLHALLLGFLYDPQNAGAFNDMVKPIKADGKSSEVDKSMARGFSQWQVCMRQSLHLNQLLCCPLTEPAYLHRLYCGPLVHQLVYTPEKIQGLRDSLSEEQKTIFERQRALCEEQPATPPTEPAASGDLELKNVLSRKRQKKCKNTKNDNAKQTKTTLHKPKDLRK
ncbi:protein asteroid homolog 1-like isoform X2 [Sardina pilchardus]|uniref:protein asteroid homolog 1-like isoform X2 n=1 Tax=Sardina pilchardus TaxID=27697 RepID=UPI002E123063